MQQIGRQFYNSPEHNNYTKGQLSLQTLQRHTVECISTTKNDITYIICMRSVVGIFKQLQTLPAKKNPDSFEVLVITK